MKSLMPASPTAARRSRYSARLREALQTLPFFGTGKAIWLQNCSFLGDDRVSLSTAVTDNLAALAKDLKEFSWQGCPSPRQRDQS